MAYDKSWKARIKNKMAPLKAKQRRGTLSADEAKLLADLRAQFARQSRRQTKSPRRVTSRGPVEQFDNAPGVRSVVSGGLPGKGRRR